MLRSTRSVSSLVIPGLIDVLIYSASPLPDGSNPNRAAAASMDSLGASESIMPYAIQATRHRATSIQNKSMTLPSVLEIASPTMDSISAMFSSVSFTYRHFFIWCIRLLIHSRRLRSQVDSGRPFRLSPESRILWCGFPVCSQGLSPRQTHQSLRRQFSHDRRCVTHPMLHTEPKIDGSQNQRQHAPIRPAMSDQHHRTRRCSIGVQHLIYKRKKALLDIHKTFALLEPLLPLVAAQLCVGHFPIPLPTLSIHFSFQEAAVKLAQRVRHLVRNA